MKAASSSEFAYVKAGILSLGDGELEITRDGPASVTSERHMKWMASRLRFASDCEIQIDHGDSTACCSVVDARLMASTKVGAFTGSARCRSEEHTSELQSRFG